MLFETYICWSGAIGDELGAALAELAPRPLAQIAIATWKAR